MTQPFPPRQQPYPQQWGQPQGWPAQASQPGWNRPQPGFGQPSWPQQPGYQQPGVFAPPGYQQPGGRQQSGFLPPGFQQPGAQQRGYPPPGGFQRPTGVQPGYPPQPGGFQPAPQRGRSPLGKVVLLVAMACGLLLAGIVVANLVTGSDGTSPRPAETYTPPPPDMNPPEPPVPTTYGEATEWLQNNAVYQQSTTIPTDCNNLKPIDALNATEAELNAHLQDLTACLLKVWHGPVEAAGFVLPRPPATVYSQPIQTACGKLDSVNASYCGGDQRIYYAKPLPTIFPKDLQNTKFLMEMIIGHEFGHTIQARTGISISGAAWEQKVGSKAAANVFSRRLEMQADCFAGMWTHAVAQSQGLTAADLDRLRTITYNLGDDVLSGKPNVDGGHGLGMTRKRWFDVGLNGGPSLSQCNTYTSPDSQVR
ncbi:MAG: neutral zinc metallopeptidase [Micropruina sp.]|uniref:neutral zinc metallopeptidase n=1 Tax=Micropruina sp. TaxID=2737536 RepID=UPI0039E4C2AC